MIPDDRGNYHDLDGRFTAVPGVPIRDYIERIFDEKDRLSESQRETLERALVEARETTEKAMVEAKNTVEGRLVEAKTAADAVSLVILKRVEILESGGAPFASRLDESLSSLKEDVSVLKDNMVRTTVLDALREQTVMEAKAQKRQIKNLYVSVGVALMIAVLNLAVALVSHGRY